MLLYLSSALFFCSLFSAHGATPPPTPTETGSPPPSFLQMGGPSPFPPDTPLLEVFFISLGLNDGIFLRCGGQTLLIDGGTTQQANRLQAFLEEENGSSHVGSILNTHRHSDHVGALNALLGKKLTTTIFYSPLSPETRKKPFPQIFQSLEKTGATYQQLLDGDMLALGTPHPAAPLDDSGAQLVEENLVINETDAFLRVYRYSGDRANANDTSIVLHITFGERTMLLMADAIGVPQHHFRDAHGSAMQADIFKAAHHGITPTVPTFLDVVDPALCIITNRQKSTVNHNQQLDARGIPALYSYGGTIYCATDGEMWYVVQK